jgi:hypothetical protein
MSLVGDVDRSNLQIRHTNNPKRNNIITTTSDVSEDSKGSQLNWAIVLYMNT